MMMMALVGDKERKWTLACCLPQSS